MDCEVEKARLNCVLKNSPILLDLVDKLLSHNLTYEVLKLEDNDEKGSETQKKDLLAIGFNLGDIIILQREIRIVPLDKDLTIGIFRKGTTDSTFIFCIYHRS